MLRIEIDMFSGRPNPSWIVTSAERTERFLRAVVPKQGVTAKQGAGFVRDWG